MKILVDMGNSALKWATVSGGVLSQVKSTGYDNFLQQLKSSWQSLSRPELIMISCVAHEQQWDEVSQLSQDLWGITPERLVSPAKGDGVVNAYQQPDNLGSDRWAVLVAAHALYRKDLCIVDCGTAMTIDLLSTNGQHLGGIIVPGAQMMQNSLQANTAVISKSTLQSKGNDEQQYWGQDTQSGIITGSWQALAGSVEKVYGQLLKQSDDAVCVLCGGGAKQLAAYLDINVNFAPELVLKGLAIIVGENIAR